MASYVLMMKNEDLNTETWSFVSHVGLDEGLRLFLGETFSL